MTKPKNDTEMSYVWENIPRDLWKQARAKALAQGEDMKTVLLDLVSIWVQVPETPQHQPVMKLEQLLKRRRDRLEAELTIVNRLANEVAQWDQSPLPSN